MKIAKDMTINVLLITYIYTNGAVKAGYLGNTLKNYYEQNSRNTVTIKITSVTYRVPFLNTQVIQAIQYVKTKMPKGFDVYVHLCNPKTSHTGQGNVITAATTTNVVHEFGHALGLSHANMNLSGKSMSSRDPFDQMTIFAPYPSTNAVHRFQLDWFLPGELINYISGKTNYTIGMLKNFADKTSAKVIMYSIPVLNDATKIKKFFISYGSKKDRKKDTFFTNYVTIHTIYGKNSSFLIGMYNVVNGKLYTNVESGLSIKMGKLHDGLVDIVVTTATADKLIIASKIDGHNEHDGHDEHDDDCEKCQMGYIEDNKEDVDDDDD